MASLSTADPLLNQERLSTTGAPSGGELLSREVVEMEIGSFPLLASTVAMMIAVGMMKSAGGREREQHSRVFRSCGSHSRFGYIRFQTPKVRLDV